MQMVFVVNSFSISFCKELERRKGFWKIVNDPFAGSPTKTLLRLLLPLNDQV
jgi:hypothetical protein